ncbi:hypothetical protein J437_LFUL002411 [Ladona fulva]|uniref:NHR domain-containing protein n=1 Tax=Ladona fulva TaxID=123851 RepID=A0A8K0KP13_LADFU|nr:hypothetical protein J437_LFUL002411 [Ladona fulva]
MSKCWKLLLVLFILCECVQSSGVCDPIGGKSISLSINSEKNKSRVWEDTFAASAEFSNSSERMHFDVKHSAFECDGKRTILIKGKINDAGATYAASIDRISFHKRCGKNAAIMDHGRAAQKISNDEPAYSQVFTNRPLEDNEIFEIKLDQKNTKFSYSLGIGIITVSPDSVNILPEMWKSPVTWIQHHGTIHNNGQGILANYGKDINKLQAGERVGVMRTEFGTLHFFVNGENQGPAASNIPSPVYGIVELWYNAMKVSIVD